MDELAHPGWCDAAHCTATPPKPHYRAGETGYHRSGPVVLKDIPNVGDVVFDAEINPLIAHLAQPAAPTDTEVLLRLGTVQEPDAVSLPANAARMALQQLGDLLTAAADPGR